MKALLALAFLLLSFSAQAGDIPSLASVNSPTTTALFTQTDASESRVSGAYLADAPASFRQADLLALSAEPKAVQIPESRAGLLFLVSVVALIVLSRGRRPFSLS